MARRCVVFVASCNATPRTASRRRSSRRPSSNNTAIRRSCLSFESIDELDHVIFVYKRNGLWGSVARSRDPGLHGRKPVFKTPRALALSYVDPYVDFTGRITAYAVVDLRIMGDYDWRFSEKNVWKVERMLLDYPHHPIRSSDRHIDRLRRRYVEFRKKFGRKPIYYRGREKWTPVAPESLRKIDH